MGKYLLVERHMVIPYDPIEEQYEVTVIYPVYHFSCSCISKTVLGRVLIQISVFISPYESHQIQNVNST